MSIGVRFNLIVVQATDGAVDFQHGQRNVAAFCHAMLAQRALQFVHADVLFLHVRFNEFSSMKQQAGLDLHHAAESATGAGKEPDKVVQR
jgi:hypothetical protein